jgi:hypothetical protein
MLVEAMLLPGQVLNCHRDKLLAMLLQKVLDVAAGSVPKGINHCKRVPNYVAAGAEPIKQLAGKVVRPAVHRRPPTQYMPHNTDFVAEVFTTTKVAISQHSDTPKRSSMLDAFCVRSSAV